MLYPSELRGRMRKLKAFLGLVQPLKRNLCPVASNFGHFRLARLAFSAAIAACFAHNRMCEYRLQHLFADVPG